MAFSVSFGFGFGFGFYCRSGFGLGLFFLWFESGEWLELVGIGLLWYSRSRLASLLCAVLRCGMLQYVREYVQIWGFMYIRVRLYAGTGGL